MLMNRRTFAAATGFAVALPSSAQFRVDISGVGATQVPIAIVRFKDEDKIKQAVSAIVRADLERSGVFRGVDNAAQMDETSTPSMPEWRAKSADLLVGGSVTRLADGRYDVRAKVWDVVKGTSIGGQSLVVSTAELRLAAHRVADFIYEKITGDKGVFSTRIAYVTRTNKMYALRVADADGEGGELVLGSADPIISPAWAPNGRELAYVSFEKQKAIIYSQDLSSGKREEVANFRGSNSAPAWSPNGQSIAGTLSRDGLAQIYVMGRKGESPRRVTNSQAIDTEAVFSPDGASLFFVSDRGGGPQIYRTTVTGGNAERVSFTGNYNISPAISPDGRLLAYISRQGGAFRLYVTELGGGGTPRALTESSDDESPSFSPNGKLILYATRARGRDVLMTTTLDGKTRAELAVPYQDVREPMWGPFGR
jgi:TolB protein